MLLALSVAGCGGDDEASAGLPACAGESRRAELPDGLPEQLPLPPGIVVTNAEEPIPGRFQLRGVVSGDLDGTSSFFKRELPENGFRLGESEGEEHEQEGEFEGHGYEGEWRVVKHPADCPVVAVFVVLTEET